MFFRFSSLLSVAGLLIVASEYGPASKVLAQSRACPAAVRTVTAAAQDPLGRTPAVQLIAHLAEGFQGTIVIPSQITVDMGSARNLWIGSCVTLSGTRGGLDPGAAIITRDDVADGPVFSIVGQNVRIRGLRFRGPLTTDDRSPRATSIKAFEVRDAATATIDKNLFEFWNVAVIVIRPLDGASCRDVAPPVAITRNYFNRNANEDAGYGVGMREGCALIEGNLFNKNRHAVASSGPAGNRQSYLARFNYVLEGGFTVCNDLGLCHWNQHFDVHGSGDGGYGGEAGEYFEIVWNTIRGEQTYYLTQTRPAFMLRGKPALGAYFSHNVVVHDDADTAVRLKNPGAQCLDFGPGAPTYSWELCNLDVNMNRYNTDLINELAVGDFDGDGRDDVFLANGTGWWYSSAGLTEWRFLRASTLRVRDLRFGNSPAMRVPTFCMVRAPSGTCPREERARQSSGVTTARLSAIVFLETSTATVSPTRCAPTDRRGRSPRTDGDPGRGAATTGCGRRTSAWPISPTIVCQMSSCSPTTRGPSGIQPGTS